MDEPITLNLTLKELQQIDKFVEVNDNTVSVLTKIKNAYPQPKMTLEKSGEFSIVSYNGETYYRNLYDGICGGWYKTDTDGEVFYLVEDETERKLEKLYQEQVVVKEPEKEQKWDVVRESVKWCVEHPNENPLDWVKPQTPEQVDAGLRNAMKQAKEDGVFDEPTKPMDEVVDRLVKKYQAQKLWNRVRDELGYSIDLCDEIVDLVEDWILDEQSSAGSQNIDVEFLVEGFNDAIRKMKEMLR